jgi:hypothetical protein
MTINRILAGAALALAFTATVGEKALAQALFEPAREVDVRAAGEPAYESTVAMRRRSVSVSLETIARHLVPAGVEGLSSAAREKQAEALDGRVDMTLFPGVATSFTRDTVEAAEDGGWVWVGKGKAGGADNAVLVIDGTRITGVVQVGDKNYRITPRGGRLHEITEEALDRLPKDLHPHTPRVRENATPDPRADRRGDVDDPKATTVIDVLVVYTRKARTASANIANEVRLAVAMANTAHRNSGTNIRLRLVATRALPTTYDEDARSYNQNLNDMTNGTALAIVRRWRDRYGADLVAMIRQGGLYCGIAWAPTPPTAAHHIFGYSVTSRGSCISGNTFAHELGHNKGLLHDRFVQASAPNSVYHFGYVDTIGRFRTIMSYSNKCTAAGVSCTRIPNYASPLRSHNGRPTGIAKGRAGAADAARKLRENAATVAAWRRPATRSTLEGDLAESEAASRAAATASR